MEIDNRVENVLYKPKVCLLYDTPGYVMSVNHGQENTIDVVNTLRDNGIVAFPRDNCTMILGLIPRPNQMEVLETTVKNLSTGLTIGVSPEPDSFLIFHEGGHTNIGCQSVVAAFRNPPLTYGCQAVSLSPAKNSLIKTGIKNTPLAILPEITQFKGVSPEQLPSSLFHPISYAKKPIYLIDPIALKVDINGSTTTKLETGRWLEVEKYFSEFFTQLETSVKKLPRTYLGETIGESLIFYTTNPQAILTIYRNLKRLQREFPTLSFTSVGINLKDKDIELLTDTESGIVIHSNPPITSSLWNYLENIHKNRSYPSPRFYLEKRWSPTGRARGSNLNAPMGRQSRTRKAIHPQVEPVVFLVLG